MDDRNKSSMVINPFVERFYIIFIGVFTMENKTLVSLLASKTKLTASIIKENGFTKEEVAEYNSALKAVKAEERLNAIKLEKCIISYKGQNVTFKPSLCSSENGTEFVIWKNLDKNAVYFACKAEDGTVAFDAIASVTTKSQFYQFRSALVKNNRKTVNPVLKEVFEGLSWEAFYGRVSGYKNIKTVNCPTVLKSL